MQYLPSSPKSYAYAFISVVLMMLGIALVLHLSRLKRKSRASCYLRHFSVAFVLSSSVMFFANATLPWREVLLPFQDVFLIVGGVALIQLAYHAPTNDQPREARWVTGAGIAMAAAITGYSLIYAYRYIFRWTPALHLDPRFFYPLPACICGLVIIFLRRAAHFDAISTSMEGYALLQRANVSFVQPEAELL